MKTAIKRHAHAASTHTRRLAERVDLRLAFGACVAFAAPASAQVVFNVSFDASASMLTSDERAEVTSHVQEAGRRWVNVIGVSGARSIEVRILIDDIPTANGASATTAFVDTIAGRDTYEQGVAHELRTGEDPNGADADANITFGLDYLRNELWFDPDPVSRAAPVPSNRTDAMSTILHEFGHVLAYNGWADLTTGEPTQTYWSIWDTWIVPGAAPVFSGPAAVAAWGVDPDLTIGNINHWGNSTRQDVRSSARCVTQDISWRWNAPAPRVCSAPESADAPPSGQRGAIAGGGSLIDQLMNGVVFFRGTRYDISALDVGVLIDVGLTEDTDPIFANGFDPRV